MDMQPKEVRNTRGSLRAAGLFSYLIAGMLCLAGIGLFLYCPMPGDTMSRAAVIRVLVWGDILDPSMVRAFEDRTGIVVHMSYYASNEELQAKLYQTKGFGYDLIIPSDYAVPLLRAQGLLKKLDHTRMPFFKRLNPRLLGHSFDPESEYSVPFEWELFGIGFDSRVVSQQETQRGWDLLFADPQGAYRVVMSHDMPEVVVCAARYLFPGVQELSHEQRDAVQALLTRQRSWVEAYTATRAGDQLINGSATCAMTTTTYLWNARKYAPFLGFVMPDDGGLLTIENFAIPIGAEHEDHAYAFMDFFYSSVSILKHVAEFCHLPATLDPEVLERLDPEARELVLMPMEKFKRLGFVKQLLPEQQMYDLWVAVKV